MVHQHVLVFLFGESATDIYVSCIGEDACTGNANIICGTGDCGVVCIGAASGEYAIVNATNADHYICKGTGLVRVLR